MSSSNTAALLYKIYSGIANPIAPEDSLANDIKFVPPKEMLGLEYTVPVRLGLEQGATYSTTHDAFTLEAAEDGVYDDAVVTGAEIAMRATMSYGEMNRLSPNKGKSSRAQEQAVGLKIANLTDGAELHREMNLFYGAGASGLASIGTISAIAVAASSGVVTINISRATFIPGFWKDFANGRVDVYTSGGSQRNTNAYLKVTGVDATKCRVQLTGNTSDAAALAANDLIFFRGARASSMVGIQAILENTGTLFTISAATYPQWRAESYSVGGTLNFDKVIEGCSQVADNGRKTGINLYLNPRTWADLMTDEAALRRYLGKEQADKAKAGFSELEFLSNCGVIKLKQHRYVKQGLAFGLAADTWKRVGSTDLTFTDPGSPNQFHWRELDNQAGAEIRCYSDQAILSDTPFFNVIFSGISNSADCVPS